MEKSGVDKPGIKHLKEWERMLGGWLEGQGQRRKERKGGDGRSRGDVYGSFSEWGAG